ISLYAFTVPLDFSFAGLMDRAHPEVARYFAASDRHGLGGLLPLLVEGPEEQLDAAVLELRLALDDLDEVRSLSVGPPREWLLAHAPWFVGPDTFGLWVALAEGSLGDAGVDELTHRLEALGRRHIPDAPRGARLILVAMTRDPFELALDSDDFPTIRETVREALEPFGVEGHFAGMAAIITQEQEATIERMRFLGPVSLVLVLLLLRLVERRAWMLVSVAIPMLLSVGCTLGIIGFVAGELTLMESVFGLIVFGMGIDFAIHLMLRLREERAAGHGFEISLQRAVAGTGRGIVSSAVTTGGAFLILGGAFLILAAAPDPVFYRLGLAGGLGLLLCLTFLMVLLPGAWALIDRP
ncbi:MAG: MMPL family transporter, partial [Deltaproteobacteria bacterium]|nr:MMPL family transporter [Deltaproteobacteria bacterium]